jgi:hypothetical protein
VADAHPQRFGNPLGTDRRRHPRFLASDRLIGTLESSDRPVRIRDVSSGGFSAETVEPVPTGQTDRVRLIASDDWSAVIEARSLYCRPTVSPSGLPRFVTGFAFAESTDARRAIATLLEKVTSVPFEAES